MAIRLKTSLVKAYEMDLGWCFKKHGFKRGTVRDNITMGNPTISEEEMIRISKLCHIHGFVSRLPQGYDTVISDDGGELLARAKTIALHRACDDGTTKYADS